MCPFEGKAIREADAEACVFLWPAGQDGGGEAIGVCWYQSLDPFIKVEGPEGQGGARVEKKMPRNMWLNRGFWPYELPVVCVCARVRNRRRQGRVWGGCREDRVVNQSRGQEACSGARGEGAGVG